jgi:hemoglobin
MSTLFEQLGGDSAISAVVDRFYAQVTTDDRVKHFFSETDMDRQRQHQKDFLTLAFGGPNHYGGKSIRAGHSHLTQKGLNDSHFDAIIEILVSTLNEFNVQKYKIEQVVAIAESVRNDVLCR